MASSDSDPDVLGRVERRQGQLQDMAAVVAVGVSVVAAVAAVEVLLVAAVGVSVIAAVNVSVVADVGVSVVAAVVAVGISVVAAVAVHSREHKPDSNPSTEILWRAEKFVSRLRLWVEHRLVRCPFVERKGGPV